jgi:hypothetical protein
MRKDMVQESKEEHYLNGRWQSQRDYYSKVAETNKLWHQSLLGISAIGSILVPVLLNIPAIPKWLPTVISVLVSAALALDNALHFGDNWRSFRQTLEILKRERAYFDAGIEPYTDAQTAFPLFVQRCEEAMGKEGESYFEKNKPVEQAVNGQSKVR